MKIEVKRKLKNAGIHFTEKKLGSKGDVLLTIVSLKNKKTDDILKALRDKYTQEAWNYQYDFDELCYRMTVPATKRKV